MFVNRDSVRGDSRWPLPDEGESPGARVRPAVRVREDFITIPFPRLATLSNQQVAASDYACYLRNTKLRN